MRIFVVAPPEECLRVKANTVLFAGNTVWSISEHVRGVREDALYKSTLPLPLPLLMAYVRRQGHIQDKDKSTTFKDKAAISEDKA